MSNLGVLIISDIHMTDRQYGRRAGQSKFKEIDNFKDKLETYIDRNISNKINIQYILLLGDASDYALETEYEEVASVLNDLCKELNVKKENVLIIPGNHDMSRIEFWSYCYKSKIREEDYTKHQAEKFKAFKQFYDEFYNMTTITFDPEKAITRVLYAEEMNLVFVGINTVYQDTFREEDHHGCINYTALRDELGKIRVLYPDQEIIALMHHTPQKLGSSGPTIQNWSDVSTIFEKYKVNIFIGAHAHTSDGIRTVARDGEKQYLTNGSLSASEKRIDSSFIILEYQEVNKLLKVLSYKYIEDWNSSYWNFQSDQENIIEEILLK